MHWNGRILIAILGLLLVGCGAAAPSGNAPVATGTAIPAATAPAASSTPAATPRRSRQELHDTLTRQIDAYASAVEQARRERGCDGTATPALVMTPAVNPEPNCTGIIYDQVASRLRPIYPEFAAYWEWFSRQANCRGASNAPSSAIPCTLMMALPSPEAMRDPAMLNRYLAEAAP